MANQYASNRRPRLRYDAYGRPMQKKQSNPLIRFLFGFLLPYLAINGLLFFLAIARPTIQADEPDTQDYQTASVHVAISSLIPVKELSASMEGDSVVLEKDGNGYLASAQSNGTLSFNVTAWNGMSGNTHVQINLLDDIAPDIDQDSLIFEQGFLQFTVTDTQSGVNFDTIYGIDGDGDRIRPSDLDQNSGLVQFSLKSDRIQVFFSDFAGNETSANFSLN